MIVKRIIYKMKRKMKMKDNRRTRRRKDKKEISKNNLRTMTMQVNLKKGMRRRQTI